MSTDSLSQMFDDLRGQRPLVSDVERFRSWAAALAQVIQALPCFEQRWACVALVADDLGRDLGLPLALAFRSLAGMLLTADDCRHLTDVRQPEEAV